MAFYKVQPTATWHGWHFQIITRKKGWVEIISLYDMSFSNETIDSSPSASSKKRLAEEKKVNVYFVPGQNKFGQKTFLYALASAALHDQFMDSLKKHGEIPDFAVIVEIGLGDPTPAIKEKIKTYYGFDHDYHANNDNTSSGDNASATGG